MADISVVFDKLHGFETAEDIAEFFRGYGIVAQPANARACAITKFVMEEVGSQNVVSTCMTATFVYGDEEEENLISAHQHTPAMTDFVKRFDQGHYPFLIEQGYELTICSCGSCGICTPESD